MQYKQADFSKTIGLRLYDTKLIEKLEAYYRDGDIRYDTKNAYLTDLIEAGLKHKKYREDLQNELAENGGLIFGRLDLLETRIKELAKSVGLIYADVYVNQQLLSAIYGIVKATNIGCRLAEKDLEYGVYDCIPLRFLALRKTLTEQYMKNG